MSVIKIKYENGNNIMEYTDSQCFKRKVYKIWNIPKTEWV